MLKENSLDKSAELSGRNIWVGVSASILAVSLIVGVEVVDPGSHPHKPVHPIQIEATLNPASVSPETTTP